MNKFQLLIFDLDGTLIDSVADLTAGVNHTLLQLGLPALPVERIKSFIGDGFTTLLTRSLGPNNLDKLPEALAIINDYYGEHLLDHTVLYPGIEEVLEHFSYLPRVIVTQKTIGFTRKIVDTLKIAHHFDLILGIDSSPYKKPDPRLILEIKKNYAQDLNKLVVIGDGINDILLAKNAGATSCAFLNGITQRELLLKEGPDLTYEDPLELKLLLS